MSKHPPQPRDHRIPIMMTEVEVERIDAWRYANHIATRAEAVRQLCTMALMALSPVEKEARR